MGKSGTKYKQCKTLDMQSLNKMRETAQMHGLLNIALVPKGRHVGAVAGTCHRFQVRQNANADADGDSWHEVRQCDMARGNLRRSEDSPHSRGFLFLPGRGTQPQVAASPSALPLDEHRLVPLLAARLRRPGIGEAGTVRQM